jgi:hypothetical protein
MPDELDKFGQFMVQNLRDKALAQHEMLQQGRLQAAHLQDWQRRLAEMPANQRGLVAAIVTDAIDTAFHDLLFAIQDAHDRETGVEVLMKGKNVAELSNMLHGEIQGESGWIARFSRFANSC